MKKLLVLLFSILISFSSYGEWIEVTTDANNGDIVVAMIENEATLKRFKRINDKIELIPENENYSPIIINKSDNFSIIGKALGVFRWYN